MTENKGYIKLYRSLLEDNDYFGDERFDRFRCWIDLLLLAEWSDGHTKIIRGVKFTINRGQIAISVGELCKRWNMANKTVISRINEFEQDGKISVERKKLCNIITIENWKKYQDYTTESSKKPDVYFTNENGSQNIDNDVVSDVYFFQTTQQNTQQTTQQTTQQPKEIPPTPPKENNIINNTQRNNARVRTYEGDFFEDLKSDQQFCEVAEMQFHLESIDEVIGYIDQFKRHCILGETKHNTRKDFKTHFRDWLRLQIQNKKQNETNQRPTKAERDAAFASHIAAKLTSSRIKTKV